MPVAVLHGINADSHMEDHEVSFLQTQLPQHEFFSLEYAAKAETFTHSITRQAETACDALRARLGAGADPEAEREVSLIGHSNGAMVSRWVIQNCAGLRVVHFVSVGGPLRGITQVPKRNVPAALQPMLSWASRKAYLENQWLGPAGYMYDPANYGAFLRARTFLGELNQEAVRNETQRSRFARLESLTLIKFAQDEIVEPPASAWFAQQVATPEGERVLPVEETGRFWDEDLLGLRELNASGRVRFALAPGRHDSLTDGDRLALVVPRINVTGREAAVKTDCSVGGCAWAGGLCLDVGSACDDRAACKYAYKLAHLHCKNSSLAEVGPGVVPRPGRPGLSFESTTRQAPPSPNSVVYV